MPNEDDINFLQNLSHYLSSSDGSLPPGVDNPEAFLQKAKSFFIRNGEIFFGTPSTHLRVLINLKEQKDLLSKNDHLPNRMLKYHVIGKEYYWPRFDESLGVHPELYSPTCQPARILRVPHHSIHLMIEENSGFLIGTVGQDSLADFLFGNYCRSGELPRTHSLMGLNEYQLHVFKVELSLLFKNIESFKDNLSVLSSFCICESLSESDHQLLETLNGFIQSDTENWAKAFPGWIFNYNNKIKKLSPTKITSTQAKVIKGSKEKKSGSSSSLGKEDNGSVVSTVRSLLSVTKFERARRGKYYKYDPEIRDAIAEFALSHGVSQASRHFRSQLMLRISSSTIRNFIRSYQAYTPELKEEIGKYAYEHGSEACLEHFKSRLDTSLSLIHRFKKYYESKASGAKNEDGSTRMFVVDIPTNAFPQEKVFFNSKLKNDIGEYAFNWGNKKAMDHFSHRLQCSMKESTIRKFKKSWMGSNDIPMDLLTKNPPPMVPKDLLQGNVEDVPPLINSAPRINNPPQKHDGDDKEMGDSSGDERVKQQRDYSSYEPELRAQIAKYALSHSNKETAAHFLASHNKVIPRSTIRFLRDKYRESSESSSQQLDFGPRGRPSRLGVYDSVLQKCIIDLALTGEKLTSFLVIATAKQVLLEHDPSLLKENGGSISLDPNWAKSILRRVQRSLKKSST